MMGIFRVFVAVVHLLWSVASSSLCPFLLGSLSTEYRRVSCILYVSRIMRFVNIFSQTGVVFILLVVSVIGLQKR